MTQLNRAAPFIFAHRVNRLYSFVQLSMVQEFIGVWKNMFILLTALTKLLHVCGSSLIPLIGSPPPPHLAPSAVPHHLREKKH